RPVDSERDPADDDGIAAEDGIGVDNRLGIARLGLNTDVRSSSPRDDRVETNPEVRESANVELPYLVRTGERVGAFGVQVPRPQTQKGKPSRAAVVGNLEVDSPRCD